MEFKMKQLIKKNNQNSSKVYGYETVTNLEFDSGVYGNGCGMSIYWESCTNNPPWNQCQGRSEGLYTVWE